MSVKKSCPYCGVDNNMDYCLEHYDGNRECEIKCNSCDRDLVVIVGEEKDIYIKKVRIEKCGNCNKETGLFYEAGKKEPFPKGYLDGHILCSKCYFNEIEE